MYKSLLVPVDQRERSRRSLEVAAELAVAFDAHLTGLYVRPRPAVPSAARIEPGVELMIEYQRKASAEMAAAAKGRFDEVVTRYALARSEWRTDEGDPADVCVTHARYADLVIVNQTDPEDESGSGPTHFAESMIMSVGRPVLIIPYVGRFETVGQTVLVPWNATREAARAVSDALPLLQRAKTVRVLAIDPVSSAGAEHGEVPSADISLFLARHGVNAVAARTPSAGLEPGDVILSHAADHGVDLIVMGAYGHSKLREFVMGGATRTVLHQMTVPVLMSR
jgi:nucleotide-binding universal stress UspA family protein